MMGICMQLKELDWDENVYGYCFFSSFFYLKLETLSLSLRSLLGTCTIRQINPLIKPWGLKPK